MAGEMMKDAGIGTIDSRLLPREAMRANTAIEWTESTWNPLTGCTKVGPGHRYSRY